MKQITEVHPYECDYDGMREICGTDFGPLIEYLKSHSIGTHTSPVGKEGETLLDHTLQVIDSIPRCVEDGKVMRIKLVDCVRQDRDLNTSSFSGILNCLSDTYHSWDDIHTLVNSLQNRKKARIQEETNSGEITVSKSDTLVDVAALAVREDAPIVLTNYAKNKYIVDSGVLIPVGMGNDATTYVAIDWLAGRANAQLQGQPIYAGLDLIVVPNNLLENADPEKYIETGMSDVESHRSKLDTAYNLLRSPTVEHELHRSLGDSLLGTGEAKIEMALMADVANHILAEKRGYLPKGHKKIGELAVGQQVLDEAEEMARKAAEYYEKIANNQEKTRQKIIDDMRARSKIIDDSFGAMYKKKQIPADILGILNVSHDEQEPLQDLRWTERLVALSMDDLITILQWNNQRVLSKNEHESENLKEIRDKMCDVIDQIDDLSLGIRVDKCKRIATEHPLTVGDHALRDSVRLAGYNNGRSIVSFYNFEDDELDTVRLIVTHEFGHSFGKLPYRFENEAATQVFAKFCEGTTPVKERLGGIFSDKELDGVYDAETVLLNLLMEQGNTPISPEVVLKAYFGNEDDLAVYEKAVTLSFGYDIRGAIQKAEAHFIEDFTKQAEEKKKAGEDVDDDKFYIQTAAVAYIIDYLQKDPQSLRHFVEK